MIIESTGGAEGGLMSALSGLSGAVITGGYLQIPPAIGDGYLRFVEPGTGLRLLFNQAVFHEDMHLKRTGSLQEQHEITFSFRNIFPGTAGRSFPAVQVSSSDIDVSVFIPARQEVNGVLIIAQVELLKNLLHKQHDNPFLAAILSGGQPYLYEEIVTPEMLDVAASLLSNDIPEGLEDFYFRLKAEQLIYLFFVALSGREHHVSYPLNQADVKAIYQVRDALLVDLSRSPDQEALQILAGMSESKLNRVFRQVFGNSIHRYYQVFRMQEAARLLSTEKLSVSETGYRMGFTNLSHFTRVFEQHTGLKPKKYAEKMKSSSKG